jgi:hypothetical protein
MCFSAEASFAASGILAATGIAIARLPKERSEIPLSLFPALFSAHQFIEGLLWLNHTGTLSDEYRSAAVYGFALIALVLWPIYVPFSAYMVEKSKIRRYIIFACQLIGFYVSITFFNSMFQNSVEASVVGHSFAYKVDSPEDFFAVYFVAVSIPFLASSDRKLVFFGIALTLSCTAALIIASSKTFPSVWCFFAALLSLGLYLHFKYSPRRYSKEGNQEVRDHQLHFK